MIHLALGASSIWVDTRQLQPPVPPCPGFFLVLCEAQAFQRLDRDPRPALNGHQDDVSDQLARVPLVPLP